MMGGLKSRLLKRRFALTLLGKLLSFKKLLLVVVFSISLLLLLLLLLLLFCAVDKRMDAKIEPHRARSVTHTI